MSEIHPESILNENGDTSSIEKQIPIHVSNGVALVWSLDGNALQLISFVELI